MITNKPKNKIERAFLTDIIILTPGDWLRGEFVTSLVNTMNRLQQEGLSIRFGNSQGALVAKARQFAWQNIRGIDFQRLVWIDSDMSWHEDDFMKLVGSENDITSGAYLDELNQVVATNLNGGRVSREQLDGQEPFEVAWCGFGFISLNKDVFATLQEPFVARGEYGEDISFCFNARNMGFKVFLDPTIKVTHHKTIAITP